MAAASLPGRTRCGSCQFEFSNSRTGYCSLCDRSFPADGGGGDSGGRVVCPDCGAESENVFPDPPMELCKHCMGKVVETLGPGDEQPKATEKPKVHDKASNSPESSPATAPVKQADAVTAHELWRYMGCVCGNHEPECFELIKAEWPKKSYYCLECKQPFSSFIWSNELPGDQCVRCNGGNLTTDVISKGDEAIKCLNCKCIVSKKRFDALSKEVETQCTAEKTAEDRSSVAVAELSCAHCGSDAVRLTITEADGNPCVAQICERCGCVDFLAGWNARTDRFGKMEEDRKCRFRLDTEPPPATPEGFQELTQCCGDLSSLHPVEDDPDDDLLVCARCQRLISLRACQDKRVPVTVSSLRRALAEVGYSTGEMGHPYRTVQVSDLNELHPGDQLDFKRGLYSHYAIVEKLEPQLGQVGLIEYTGRSKHAVLAFFRSLSLARIQRSSLKFNGKAKDMHRVDYHSLDCFHPDAVLSRAATRVNEEKYNLITGNCEHFTNWAKAGIKFSRQVEKLKEAAKSALRNAVTEISELMDDLPQENKSVRAAVAILQDIRAEMLLVLGRGAGSASARSFWCPIKLLIKWFIRGFPLILSAFVTKATGFKLMWHLDGILKPISEAVDSLIPSGKESKDKKKGQNSE